MVAQPGPKMENTSGKGDGSQPAAAQTDTDTDTQLTRPPTYSRCVSSAHGNHLTKPVSLLHTQLQLSIAYSSPRLTKNASPTLRLSHQGKRQQHTLDLSPRIHIVLNSSY